MFEFVLLIFGGFVCAFTLLANLGTTPDKVLSPSGTRQACNHA